MKQTEELSASVDIKLSKDDVFNVVVSERESIIENLIEDERKTLESINEKRFSLSQEIDKILIKHYNLTDVSYSSYRLFTKEKSVCYKIYDIDNLSKLKRPNLSKNKFNEHTIQFSKVDKNTNYILTLKRKYSKDGFEGILEREINVKDLPKSILESINKICLKYYNIEKEYYEQLKLISELEYELLTLDNNHRKIKAEIAKKFIPSDDLNNLLQLSN